jgi:hypothetical protein
VVRPVLQERESRVAHPDDEQDDHRVPVDDRLHLFRGDGDGHRGHREEAEHHHDPDSLEQRDCVRLHL